MRFIGVAFVLAASATAHAQDSEPQPAQCTPACRSGYVCIDGACVSACNPACADDERCVGNDICERRAMSEPTPSIPSGPVVSITPPGPVTVLATRSPSADSNLAFHINLLGLLQFGPTLALELGGKTASFAARFRALNAGALSYVLVADASDGETLDFSYGLAATLRIYTAVQGNMRGFYWGPGVELVHARVVEDESVAYTTELVIPELEIGYRWAFGSLLVEVGAAFGYGFVTSATSELIADGGTLYSNDAENGAKALGTVAVGAFF
jgi:hypothetical protein